MNCIDGKMSDTSYKIKSIKSRELYYFYLFSNVEHELVPSPAPLGPTALVIVVMARHGALYPLLLPLWPQVIRL